MHSSQLANERKEREARGKQHRVGIKNLNSGDFPGGPVAKTPCSQCKVRQLIPAQATRSNVPQLKIPRVAKKTWHSQINTFLKREREYEFWSSASWVSLQPATDLCDLGQVTQILSA